MERLQIIQVLCVKAADAGYRLIIVIAGIHNNLRNQTQERIDEGFIGLDSGKEWGDRRDGRKYVLGVGLHDCNRRPVCLTTRFHDFNKIRADSDSSEIGHYNEPVILIIKKNHNTLGNLIDWLKDNSARGDQEMIDQPMLLIDDEADNASINTKYGKETVTTINRQIRELLNLFNRRCYIGYTATPFANIFIDPDEDDEMLQEDLFPRDFIIGLDTPSNYLGPEKIFLDDLPDEEASSWLREITDNEDILPIKHPSDFVVHSLPKSLIDAIRTFLLGRAIRNIRGESHRHCSMLVNASWRNAIQRQLRNHIYDVIENIQNSARLNLSKNGICALKDPEISALREIWEREYSDCGIDWSRIQANLHDSIASAKVIEVNNSSSDVLDYPKEEHGKKGKTYITIGGYSLSRGLTLEGLMITWFLRNSMMYDTLMQMGRWFGYREEYEDICRIWIPPDAIEWYSFIANAADELHNELRNMEKVKATPKMFGLEVRSHPASLLVTARNKMGSSQRITTMVGLSNKYLETSKISTNPDYLNTNIGVASSFVSNVSKLDSRKFLAEKTQWGSMIRNVPVEYIDIFLAGWRNVEQSVTTETTPIRKYIRDRNQDELKKWDVLIVSLGKGEENEALGTPIIPIQRSIDPNDLKDGFISFSGKRMRIGSRGIEKAGVNPEKAEQAEREYHKDKGIAKGVKANYPDKIYRKARDYGLFILYYVKACPKENVHSAANLALIPSSPVVAWGISFPVSSRSNEPVEYVVNTVRYRELFDFEDEDDEDALQYA